MSDSVELKPCLFCKTATQQHLFCLPTEYEDYEAVECQLCGARGPVKLGDHAAITAWNTRATDQLLDEMAEALDAMVTYVREEGKGLRIADEVMQKYREQKDSKCKQKTK